MTMLWRSIKNIAVIACVWWAALGGPLGAVRVVYALGVLAAVVGLFSCSRRVWEVALEDRNFRWKCDEWHRHVPAWLDGTIDMAMLGPCIVRGWWIPAVGFFLLYIGSQIGYLHWRERQRTLSQ